MAMGTGAVLCVRSPAGDRHVRITCTARRAGDLPSDRLFDELSRPEQLRVWAGPGSTDEAREKFAGQLVPRPRHWGAYRLDPTGVELGPGDEPG